MSVMRRVALPVMSPGIINCAGRLPEAWMRQVPLKAMPRVGASVTYRFSVRKTPLSNTMFDGSKSAGTVPKPRSPVTTILPPRSTRVPPEWAALLRVSTTPTPLISTRRGAPPAPSVRLVIVKP